MRFNSWERNRSANTQAELYHQCRLAGIDCVVEYQHKNCRFDAVIVEDNQIIAIIEVKAGYPDPERALENSKQTKQYQKYAALGVPVIYCYGKQQINHTLNEILKIYENLANNKDTSQSCANSNSPLTPTS